jgi:hypothetical protein
MKVKDIFLPKIANSDPEVRKKAIEQETNPNLLKIVARDDEDYTVRLLAKIRLIDLTAMS